MSDRKDSASSMTAITLIGVFGIAGYTVLAGVLGPGFAIPTALIGLVSSAIILRGPVGKALARRLEGGTAGPDSEQALMEVDELRERVVELEERLDFAERLLAQGRQGAALTGGTDATA